MLYCVHTYSHVHRWISDISVSWLSRQRLEVLVQTGWRRSSLFRTFRNMCFFRCKAAKCQRMWLTTSLRVTSVPDHLYAVHDEQEAVECWCRSLLVCISFHKSCFEWEDGRCWMWWKRKAQADPLYPRSLSGRLVRRSWLGPVVWSCRAWWRDRTLAPHWRRQRGRHSAVQLEIWRSFCMTSSAGGFWIRLLPGGGSVTNRVAVHWVEHAHGGAQPGLRSGSTALVTTKVKYLMEAGHELEPGEEDGQHFDQLYCQEAIGLGPGDISGGFGNQGDRRPQYNQKYRPMPNG